MASIQEFGQKTWIMFSATVLATQDKWLHILTLLHILLKWKKKSQTNQKTPEVKYLQGVVAAILLKPFYLAVDKSFAETAFYCISLLSQVWEKQNEYYHLQQKQH